MGRGEVIERAGLSDRQKPEDVSTTMQVRRMRARPSNKLFLADVAGNRFAVGLKR